eukprot:RCo037983
MSSQKHVPRIVKKVRPTSAPLGSHPETPVALLDGGKRSRSKRGNALRAVSSTDWPTGEVPSGYAGNGLQKERRVNTCPPRTDCAQAAAFRLLPGTRAPAVVAASQKKVNNLMIIAEDGNPQGSNCAAPEAVGDDDSEPLCEPIAEDLPCEEEERGSRQAAERKTVSFQAEEADQEFPDDFDTDEEPPPAPPVAAPGVRTSGVGLYVDRNCWGRLISLTQNLPGADLTTKETVEFTVGRSSKCNIVIEDPMVSSTQFALTMYNRAVCEVEIRDCSTNGTYVNALRLGKRKTKTLANGDEITFQVGEKLYGGVSFAGYIFQFLPPDFHGERQAQYGVRRHSDATAPG